MIKIVLIILSITISLSRLIIPSGWQICPTFWRKTCSDYCISLSSSLSHCWVDTTWLNGYTGSCDSISDWKLYFNRCVNRVRYRRVPNFCSRRKRVQYSHRDIFRRRCERLKRRIHSRDYSINSSRDRTEARSRIIHESNHSNISRRRSLLQTETSSIWDWSDYVNCKCLNTAIGYSSCDSNYSDLLGDPSYGDNYDLIPNDTC